MIAVEDEDGVLVEPELLVLLYQALDEEIHVADAVQVAILAFLLGEALYAVPIRGEIVVVGRDGLVGRQEGFVVAPLLKPILARLQHDVVLVAEVVGLLEAPLVHGLDRVERLVPPVHDDPPFLLPTTRSPRTTSTSHRMRATDASGSRKATYSTATRTRCATWTSS